MHGNNKEGEETTLVVREVVDHKTGDDVTLCTPLSPAANGNGSVSLVGTPQTPSVTGAARLLNGYHRVMSRKPKLDEETRQVIRGRVVLIVRFIAPWLPLKLSICGLVR